MEKSKGRSRFEECGNLSLPRRYGAQRNLINREIVGSAKTKLLQNPILLLFFETLMHRGIVITQFVFFMTDLLAAHFLAKAVVAFRREELEKEKEEKSSYAKDVEPLLLEGSDSSRIGRIVLITYIALLSSVAMTLTTFGNFIVTLALYLSISGSKTLCFVVLAFATVTDVYPAIFIVPLLVSMYTRSFTSHIWLQRPTGPFCPTLLAPCTLLLQVFKESLKAQSNFRFTLSDLTPNVGLFWYYFAETFEHYRLFFLCVFHLSFLTYALPISVCLRDDRFTACFFMLFVITLFKSYPSISDAAVYSSLLPAFSHLFYYVRYGLPVTCTIITCSALSCIMWHLWIEQGSANANFFFAVTLAYAVAQVSLMNF
ncbi:PIG-U domain containing protein [Trichuris trichiura]|uniref:PIG-U domain containing protein n=1 Tax=Trichuris trichiura TaxID=36087 RepID=A0A077Z0E9_TRITR|nr:PIG-U domain containing protein [Trichuris trichiura]